MNIASAIPCGVLDTGDDLPGFRQLIYSNGDHYLTSLVDKDSGRITEFEMALDISEEDILPLGVVRSKVSIDDKTLYAYKFPRKPVVSGTRPEICYEISKGLRRLSGFPFARLEVASFLKNQKLLARYAREALAAYIINYENASIEQIRPIIDQFFQLSPNQNIHIYDFCRGIIRFYKAYRRMLHVENEQVAYECRRKLDQATQFILPFLLDADFLQCVEKDATAFALDVKRPFTESDADVEQVVTVLTRFGVSRNSALRFLRHADEFIDGQMQLPLFNGQKTTSCAAGERVLSKAGVLVPLTYRAISVQHEIDEAINRIEKKIRKRHAEAGFAAIAYGLLLVLEAEFGEHRVSSSVRGIGLRAIGMGFQMHVPVTGSGQDT